MTTEREAHLLRDAYAAGITQPRELANFMAQAGHESGGLERIEESFRYTRSAEQISSNVRSALREGRDVLEAARLEALAGRPEPLAELMYGERMGNTEPGDGYRGRGYMQIPQRCSVRWPILLPANTKRTDLHSGQRFARSHRFVTQRWPMLDLTNNAAFE